MKYNKITNLLDKTTEEILKFKTIKWVECLWVECQSV